ncbi:MAG TPA: YihY/virulence factor BrkB family protein [Usitatibacter sp.]|jgi:membrane protein|nr:YihY/virulence factor BrkB family protein [Usitatibacter sp.]
MRLSPAEGWNLVKRAFSGWVDDAAPSMGAALAFYTLFSLAPVLLLAISVAGFFMGRDEAQNLLITQLTGMLGEKASIGIETMLDAAGSRDPGKIPALVGTLTLALGATTVFAELRTDLDRIWRCSAKKASGVWDFARTRLLSFSMVIAIGFLLLVSLVVSTAVAAIGDRWFGGTQAVAHALDFVASSIVITGLFASIFKLLPTASIAWRDVWVGAAITALLFWFGKFLIGLYIGKAAVGSAFGAAGTLVVVIVWVYYSAQIFFLGAEFTREFALTHGSKRGEPRAFERRRHPPAANEEHMVERARDIVAGRDPAVKVTSTP